MKMLEKAIYLYKNHYKEKKEDAAYSGSYGDGGYGLAINYINIFNAGIEYAKNGTIPQFLKEYFEAAEKQADPEYQEYIRLKNKFKN
jgi:hypothetical protein